MKNADVKIWSFLAKNHGKPWKKVDFCDEIQIFFQKLSKVSHGTFSDTDSIGNFLKNICISSKNRLFSKVLVHGFWPKMIKF